MSSGAKPTVATDGPGVVTAIRGAVLSLTGRTLKYALVLAFGMVVAVAVLAMVSWLYVAPWRGWIWACSSFLIAAALVVIPFLWFGIPLAMALAVRHVVERDRLGSLLVTLVIDRVGGSKGAETNTTPRDSAGKGCPSADLSRSVTDALGLSDTGGDGAARGLLARIRASIVRRSLRWLLADVVEVLESTPHDGAGSEWARVVGPIADRTLASKARATARRLLALLAIAAAAATLAAIGSARWP